jgi:dephospho-CoA kinase
MTHDAPPPRAELPPPPPWLPPRAHFPHLRIVGILGGVASGKSTAARALADAGCLRLDADELSRARFAEPEVREALVHRFGPAILGPDGGPDRAAVARATFADEAARRYLESLIHPAVRARLLEALVEAERLAAGTGRVRWIVLDIPLLAESGWIHLCDHVLFLETPSAQRDARARRDRGWEAGEVARREAAQVPLDLKRRLAERIFANEDVGALRAELGAWLEASRSHPG